MSRLLLAFACLASLTLSATPAAAGPIFFAGTLKDGTFTKNKDLPASPYLVRYSTVHSTVEKGVARTTVEESIRGPEKTADALCLIPLPAGTLEKGAGVQFGGSETSLKAVNSAKFLSAADAQKLYQSLAKTLDSTALLQFTGQPALLVSKLNLPRKLVVQVTFRQPVKEVQGTSMIEAPLPISGFAHGPVDRLALTADIKTDKPLRAVFSPTHEHKVTRDGLQHANVSTKLNDFRGDSNFRLCWVADEKELGLRVLSYRAEEDEDGYFMLIGNPTGSPNEQVIHKDVIFVLDTSGSMRGEKIEQSRAAIEYCLEHLNAGDRFNIVTFGTEVQSFREEPVAKTVESHSAAQTFIESIVSQGRTNISDALVKSVTGEPEAGRPRIAIFLTDGTPTAGEQVDEKILEMTVAANTSKTQIFVLGVGHDVNSHLLDQIAEKSQGSVAYVEPHQEIDQKMASLYDRLSHPVLTNVELSFDELPTHSIFPRKIPSLFRGSDVMITGRYREGGRKTVLIQGENAGVPKQFAVTVDFPQKSAGKAVEFVAPLWATRKVGYLLQEIRLHGEDKELVQEIVRLSKKFGIFTEYTQTIASVGGGLGGAQAEAVFFERARGALVTANQLKSGRAAVNQAINNRELQTRRFVANYANRYRDQLGREQTNELVKQIGGKTYYCREGQWCDAVARGERKERKVQLFSEEYFKLLKDNKDFARAQQLGWAVTVNIGDERIVVEKDGKTKDEELLKKSQPAQTLQQNNLNQFGNRRGLQQQLPLNQLQNNEIQFRNRR